jgi:hypothetical protein
VSVTSEYIAELEAEIAGLRERERQAVKALASILGGRLIETTSYDYPHLEVDRQRLGEAHRALAALRTALRGETT